MTVQNMVQKVTILALLGLSSCVSLEVPVSGNRFITSEVSGELAKGKAGGSVYSTTNIVLVRDIDESPQDTDHPDLRGGGSIGAFGSLGVYEKLDLRLDSALGVGAIFQVLGNSSLTVKTGDWSMAIHTHVDEKNLDKNISSGSRSYTIDSHALAFTLDYGAVAGYRTADGVLLYLGLGETRIRALGEVKRKKKDSGEEFNYTIEKATGVARSANVGVHFGESRGFFATLECGYMMTYWPNTDSFERMVYGVSMGGAW